MPGPPAVVRAARGRPGARFATGAAAALPPALVYLATLAPGLPAGDSGELIAVAATGGVAHPPGYPLWTMLAAVWLRALPAGDAAWRLNVFSAVTMAAAAAVLAHAVARASRSRVAGVLAAWAFALAIPVWRNALVAEVFALNALLAAVLLALAASSHARRASIALAFVTALALSHHHTLLLLAAPALAVALARAWRAMPAPRARWLAAVAAAAIAGLAPLAWLPIATRHAGALVWGQADTWRGFLAHVTRAEYGSLSLAPEQAGFSADRSHLLIYLASLPRQFGALPLALAAIGAAALGARRHRALAATLVAYALLQAAFLASIAFPSRVAWLRGVVERFYVLPDLVLAFVAGLGAAWLLSRARTRAARVTLATALLCATAAIPLALYLRALDQRGNRFTGSLGRALLASLPPGAVLFVSGDLPHNALAYVTRVQRLRPDVVVLDQELMSYPWYVRRARAEHPGVLPPLGRAQRIALADGRALEGVAIPRADGTTDLLVENGQRTVPTRAVRAVTDAPPESLFRAARARFASGLRESGEDRYSGLPGTRNLLWIDALEGRRPVAFLGTRDDSDTLRYRLDAYGLVWLARPKGSPEDRAGETAAALAALAQTPVDAVFRRQQPTSFEAAERWRLIALFARAALLACQPDAAAALSANTTGHDRLLALARGFEASDAAREPLALRSAGFLRMLDPSFRDLAQARRDLERYRASGGDAARDADVARALAELDARSGAH
ncbi:MAG TPA: DUF2723 domain-containing protein [Candidatus Eisenbacteria bacterium]|nr:DUF2723 domain-containing protein [Candidatus Eisenbacteria bacterium]